MINLLPENARREARREYVRRVAAVAGFMAAAVCAAGAATMIPISYGLGEDRAAIRAVEAQTASALADPTAASTAAAVRQASALVSAIGQDAKLPRPSAVLQLLLSARPKGIGVEQISLSAGDPISVIVVGLADTRDDLLAFKSALLAIPGVTNADFPASDLAASSTVSFSMTVSYTPPAGNASVLPLPMASSSPLSSTSSALPAAPVAASSSPASPKATSSPPTPSS